jgi:PleD family two-component response regulator
VKNEDAQEFARKLGEFEKSCGLTNPESQNMIHFSASIGYDWGKVESEEDMRSLIRNADQYLYVERRIGSGADDTLIAAG